MAMFKSVNALYLVIFSVFQAGWIAALALFAFGGVESSEYFGGVAFYYAYGLMGLAGVAAFYILGKNKAKFGYAVIHDPTEGLFSKYKILSFWRWTFLGVIVWGIVGMFSFISNTFFWQIPALQQQFTETGKLLSAIEPASTSETLFDLFLFFLYLSIWKKIFPNQTKGELIASSFLPLGILTGFSRVALHFARYQGSELALIAVFIPAFIHTIIILVTGSVVWYFEWHIMNNLFYGARKVFESSDAVIITTIVIFSILAALFLIVQISQSNRRRQSHAG